MSDELIEIEGEVTRILRFDNGYTILTVTPPKKLPIVLVGSMPSFAEGMNIKAKATIVNHPKYGTQYKVVEIEETGFNATDALIDYLSGSFFGIGHSLARKIVDKFGLNTMDILDKTPERVQEIEGIGKTRTKEFIDGWQEQREAHKTMTTLMGMGMTLTLAMKAYNHFKPNTIAVIKENPYSLIDIPGIGFQKADEIARHMGIAKDSPFRIKAAILYILDNKLFAAGHCYLQLGDLIDESVTLLDYAVNHYQINDVIKTMKDTSNIIVEEGRVYLSSVYSAEKEVTDKLKEMLSYSDVPLYSSIDSLKKTINKYGIMSDIELAPEQEEAILTALNNRVAIITGGPGTGKSTQTKAICELLKRKGIDYQLCSPTGRAAKRLSEATGDTAQTIHRMLGFTHGSFEYNSENPLPTRCVIVDEFSMVDILLFRHLLAALEPDTRLILVGDADQLPSVGPGNVLHDLIESNIIPVVRLKVIFRQEKGSTITSVAHQILKGEIPELNSPAKSKGKRCMLVAAENKDTLISHIISLVNTHLPNAGINQGDIQVLTPMRERGLGINDLNPRLQEVLNPPDPSKPELKSDFRILRVGDRVMQIRNDYDKNVFNGDVGVIASINKQSDTSYVFVKYPDIDELIEYPQCDWGDLQLAHAMTIHKCQGSEYPVVVLVLHPSQSNMLQRNLLYTGLTRAKKLCIIAGTQSALETAVKNNKEQKRNTTLKMRLIQEENHGTE